MELRDAIIQICKEMKIPAERVLKRGKPSAEAVIVRKKAQALVNANPAAPAPAPVKAAAKVAVPATKVAPTPKAAPTVTAPAAPGTINILDGIVETDIIRAHAALLCIERNVARETVIRKGITTNPIAIEIRSEARRRFESKHPLNLDDIVKSEAIPEVQVIRAIAIMICRERGLDPAQILRPGISNDPVTLDVRAEARRRLGLEARASAPKVSNAQQPALVGDSANTDTGRPIPTAAKHFEPQPDGGVPVRMGTKLYLRCSGCSGRMFGWRSLRTFEKVSGEARTFTAASVTFECDTCDKYMVDVSSVQGQKIGTFRPLAA